MHFWFLPQATQATPFRPQVALLLGWHTPLEQQPFAQLLAPHGAGVVVGAAVVGAAVVVSPVQTCETQVAFVWPPAWQLRQSAPREPQLVPEVPALQPPRASQQPLKIVPTLQMLQMPPPTPQTLAPLKNPGMFSCVPEPFRTQMSSVWPGMALAGMQQPSGQVVTEQRQRSPPGPSSQRVPGGQVRQVPLPPASPQIVP